MICNIITQPVRDLAKELNISPSYANNLVSVWRNVSKSTTEDYPKANTLKSIMKWNQEIELATPEYTAIEYNEGDKLASTSKDYKITLRKVFSKKPLEYFFDYIQGNVDSATSKQKQIVFERLEKQGYSLDKIRDLVQDGKEAYRFLLWHEMSHIENDDYSNYWKEGQDFLTEDKIEIEYRATLDALKKAEAWRKKYPIKRTQERKESEQSKGQQERIINQEQAEKIKSLGENHSMFSGEAEGSDLYWRGIANQYGIKGEDFNIKSINKDTRAEATEKVEQANKTLNRVFPVQPNKERTQKQADYINNLILRDWLQVKNADTIIAIGKLKNSIVEGGTGWAVQMAINEG